MLSASEHGLAYRWPTTFVVYNHCRTNSHSLPRLLEGHWCLLRCCTAPVTATLPKYYNRILSIVSAEFGRVRSVKRIINTVICTSLHIYNCLVLFIVCFFFKRMTVRMIVFARNPSSIQYDHGLFLLWSSKGLLRFILISDFGLTIKMIVVTR